MTFVLTCFFGAMALWWVDSAIMDRITARESWILAAWFGAMTLVGALLCAGKVGTP